MDDVDPDDFNKKFEREIKREKFVSIFILVGLWGYVVWDSYHSQRDWQNYYWLIMFSFAFVIYQFYQLDKKIDLILQKIYDLNH